MKGGDRCNAQKTHCPQGHPYDEENTLWYRNSRRCKACDRARANQRYAQGFKPTTPPFRGSAEFFSAHTIHSQDGCWGWAGRIDGAGYGRWSRHLAHRLSYEFHVGPIPEGLVIDHLCRNRSCVNPVHLEVVTQKVNVRRGVIARANGVG